METNAANIFKVDEFTSVPVTTYVTRNRVQGIWTTLNINGVETKLTEVLDILTRVEDEPALIFSPDVEALVSIRVVEVAEDGFVTRSINFERLKDRLAGL